MSSQSKSSTLRCPTKNKNQKFLIILLIKNSTEINFDYSSQTLTSNAFIFLLVVFTDSFVLLCLSDFLSSDVHKAYQ